MRLLPFAFGFLSCYVGFAQIPDSTRSSNASGIYRSVHFDHRDYQCQATSGKFTVEITLDSLCRITKKSVLSGIDEYCDKAILRKINDDFELALMRANDFHCTPGDMQFLIPIVERK